MAIRQTCNAVFGEGLRVWVAAASQRSGSALARCRGAPEELPRKRALREARLQGFERRSVRDRLQECLLDRRPALVERDGGGPAVSRRSSSTRSESEVAGVRRCGELGSVEGRPTQPGFGSRTDYPTGFTSGAPPLHQAVGPAPEHRAEMPPQLLAMVAE